MHTHDTEIEEVPYRCKVNGDFSGDVVIAAPLHTFKYSTNYTLPWQYEEVSIPFELFQEMVGRYLESEIVSKLEEMSGKDIIEWIKGV